MTLILSIASEFDKLNRVICHAEISAWFFPRSPNLTHCLTILFQLKIFISILQAYAYLTPGNFPARVYIEGVALPAADGAVRDEFIRLRRIEPIVRQKQASVHLRLLGMKNPASLPTKSPG